MAQRIGRYLVFDEFARGGMASVHLGRLDGSAGFKRMVAIKKLNPEAAHDPDTKASLQDEALLSARISHRNVVQVFDMVEEQGELLLVMEYVHGLPLSALLRDLKTKGERMPPPIALALIADLLEGLHAAHTAVDAQGQPLEIVHRDVSPQNLLVGLDGVAKVLDFGIAKAKVRSTLTSPGRVKGKMAYLSPEQIHGQASAASDVYAAGLTLYEALAGQRAYPNFPNEGEAMAAVLLGRFTPIDEVMPALPVAITAIVEMALRKEPGDRFASAALMAEAVRQAGSAPVAEVAQWVTAHVGPQLAQRQVLIHDVESSTAVADGTGAPPVVLPRRRWPVLPVVLGFGAVGVLISVAVLAARQPVDTPTVQVLPEVPKAATPEPVKAPEPSEPVTTPPPETPNVVSEPAPEPADHPGVAGGKRKRPPPKLNRAKDAKPLADCDPPFKIDAQGHKQYKPECF